MSGTPVFLASLSRRALRTGRTIFVPDWPNAWITDGTATLRRLIGPMGNRQRERLFRMNMTLCLHRALTDEEQARLPASFWEGESIGIAGAPVEVLWESEPGADSTKPCRNPGHALIPGYEGNPHGWVPIDCHNCFSCLARLSA